MGEIAISLIHLRANEIDCDSLCAAQHGTVCAQCTVCSDFCKSCENCKIVEIVIIYICKVAEVRMSRCFLQSAKLKNQDNFD